MVDVRWYLYLIKINKIETGDNNQNQPTTSSHQQSSSQQDEEGDEMEEEERFDCDGRSLNSLSTLQVFEI